MIRELLRSAHISAGMVTLATAVVAMSLTKGSVHHRTAGRVFVFAGRAVLGTALVSCTWALLHPGSFAQGYSPAEIDEIATPLRLLFGVLGVLLLLATGDLETGLAGVRPSRPARFRAVGTASMVAGAALLAGGVYGLTNNAGGISWFAIVLGIVGLGDGDKVRNRTVSADPLISHLTGMIGAASGYLAAFLVFGAGRILPISVEEGDPLAAVPVLFAIALGHGLTTSWSTRVKEGRIQPQVRHDMPDADRVEG